ncbi:UDP-N-acetylmuramoyl-tripeptide--D-alanyl-D-alanine ligase [Anaeromicropila herbilytica]|uniref:UDP-N-acetylmuramoyl-tripeptide--D-alanyl-D-alanine ligase n=1 Tax=Anaeromicropila herbilytica TaxID=2785025 RepID=A0A7R7EMG1_9FIRM|nr:UDP-N-acetylmuramoyl-tripeptide--D-alanyl-D-alanine ligase [Anaeromicropila herbilytica]BCN31575.1 UDP-N-acetylmuramoyl-tripeptide--D-alanyl-D-alanine ligase [Anaeromicropila herbilytica]
MEPISIKEILNAVNGTLLCGDETSTISSVSTNSKEIGKNALFVPIIGERVDAHQFIDGAFHEGAIATFTSRNIEVEKRNKEKAYILVEDTLKALQVLASHYRNKFKIPVIGITGSVGKTTTKEMISAALETKYNVLKTAGNMNSQVGLPLTIFRIEKEHDVAVIEMGMSEEGEMEKLAHIARPSIAVMTNIGVSHIAQLKTRENIRKEKLNIINEFGEDGTLYVNGDDDLLVEIYKAKLQNSFRIDMNEKTKNVLEKTSVIAFGIGEHASYCASEVTTKDEQTSFNLAYEDKKIEVILNVLGIHNVYNASVALAIAKHLGIDPEVAKEGLYKYQPIAMRGQIHEANGVKFIDDTYNASPDSMKSGIEVLVAIEEVNRRIAVLADVLELGEISYKCHYEVGEYIAKRPINMVVTIGKWAHAIKDAIDEKNPSIQTVSFENNTDAIAYLKENLQEKDVVLLKGSRGMKIDEIVKAFVK